MTPLTVGTRLGAYEIVALAGTGGMSQVYRACDTRLDRIVAIKVLPQDVADDSVRRERFEREARAVSALNHPHICQLYDVGRHDGVDFLVMEYCDGETLAERLAKRPLRLEQALKFAIEIVEAVDAAHSRGLTHRDLKPANIMLTATGVKLLDFGVAKWRAEIVMAPDAPVMVTADAGNRGLTADGAIVGTLNYMAPEQLEGRSADERADFFALGAIIYEMTAGRPAFVGISHATVMASILEREPPRISSLPSAQPVSPALERLVMKCLARNPDERWQTARDLASELKWIAETSRVAAPSDGSRRRSRWIAATTALSISAFAMLVALTSSTTPPATRPAAIRFEILPPSGVELSPSASGIAVSPDGRHVAFLAVSAGGPRRIWIRSLDTLASRELSGTDDALAPFWSSDSRYVAYFAGTRLKKVDVFGGAPQIVCEWPSHPSRGAPGGTWNADGVILFGNARGLYRVSENGGAATRVTSLDESNGETDHVLPQFLPDGRHFTYMVQKGGTRTEIYVGSLDSPERRRVVSDSSQTAYAKPGYLLFVRDGVLLSQRFDVSSLQLAGETTPIADRVGYNPSGLRAMFSVSQTGVVAFRAASELELGWFDRAGHTIGTLGAGGPQLSPALSPDAHRVAVARFDPATGTRSIWVIEPNRNIASRLSSGPWDANPVWSPDGSRVAYAVERNGDIAIHEKPSNGAGEENILLESSGGSPTDWSPDGRFIIYDRLRDGTPDLQVLPLFDQRTPDVIATTPFSERHATLSPDGRWLAYSSDESGQYEVYVRSFPEPEGKWQVSTAGGVEPRWRGDGKELFFIAADQNLMAVPIEDAGALHLGTPMVLFKTRTDASGRLGIVGRNQYVVTSDGQRFLINQPRLSVSGSPITVILDWTSLLFDK